MNLERVRDFFRASRFRRVVLLSSASIVGFAGLGVWLAPRGIALYHEHVAGRALAEAISLASPETGREGLWDLALFPSTNPDARSLAQEAISSLELAATLDPRLSHAYLLLGRSHVLLGEHAVAIQAYRQYIRLRPDNPLVHWELAQALEMACLGGENAPGRRGSIKSVEQFACEEEALQKSMVAEWHGAGLASQDFLDAGESARQAGRYKEALTWYERALKMGLGPGDMWYYKGLAYEGLEEWEDALRAYGHAIEAGAFSGVGRSSPYYRIGRIYQWQLEPQQPEAALAAYAAAIETDDFNSDWEAADSHYKRGEIFGWQSRDPRESIVEFQQALSFRTDHHWARLRLGYALYWADRDVKLAEIEIGRAIEIWPNDAHQTLPYTFLGDIYRDAGLIERAIAAYREVLRIDPDNKGAEETLTSLLENRKNP